MKWLRKWLGLCEHKWMTVAVVPLKVEGDFSIKRGSRFILHCKNCGEYKKRDVI